MTTAIECHPPVAAKRPAPDLKAVKAKQQAAWSSGDYAVIGAILQIVGERGGGHGLACVPTVLDVAAGNGNITRAAVRRWCELTSADSVESLLELGRKRAEADTGRHEFVINDEY
jgi:2-polyprenyl-3-methyl-5-hydroxy-6-metoxy-1,4-benzoquinol methylase